MGFRPDQFVICIYTYISYIYIYIYICIHTYIYIYTYWRWSSHICNDGNLYIFKYIYIEISILFGSMTNQKPQGTLGPKKSTSLKANEYPLKNWWLLQMQFPLENHPIIQSSGDEFVQVLGGGGGKLGDSNLWQTKDQARKIFKKTPSTRICSCFELPTSSKFPPPPDVLGAGRSWVSQHFKLHDIIFLQRKTEELRYWYSLGHLLGRQLGIKHEGFSAGFPYKRYRSPGGWWWL